MLGEKSVQNPLTYQNVLRHKNTQTYDAIQWLLKIQRLLDTTMEYKNPKQSITMTPSKIG
jgi:hypothetical protein